jgi:hypothetical protein
MVYNYLEKKILNSVQLYRLMGTNKIILMTATDVLFMPININTIS